MPRSRPRRSASSAALREAVVVGDRKRAREDLGKVAAVVGRTDRRLVRHRLRRDQVAPPDLRAIDAERLGRAIGEPLQHVTGLRPAGAAEGVGRRRVGEDASHFDEDRGRAVAAGEQARCRSRSEWRRRRSRHRRRDWPRCRRAGRGNGRRRRAQARAWVEVIAGLVVRHEAFGAGRHPAHRTAAAGARPRRRCPPPDRACPCSRSRRRHRARSRAARSRGCRAARSPGGECDGAPASSV